MNTNSIKKGVMGVLVLWIGLFAGFGAPAAPRLTSPRNAAVLVNPGPVTLSWGAVRNARLYEVRIRAEQSPSGPIDARYTTVEPLFSIALHPNCKWTWSVRARDSRSWGRSASRHFYTWDGVGCPPNRNCGPGSPGGGGGGNNPGPGNPAPPNNPPTLGSISGPTTVSGFLEAVGRYSVVVRDDGLPKPPGRTSVRWELCQLTAIQPGGEFQLPTPACTGLLGTGSAMEIRFRQSGLYEIRAVASDGEKSSALATLRVRASVKTSVSIPNK